MNKKTFLLFLSIVISVIAAAQTKSIVYFDSNKSDLKPAAIKALDSLADFLKDKNCLMVDVKGYCDNSGNNDFNQILSEKRAETVYNYISANYKNSIKAISSKGNSSSLPIGDNATEEGKAKNRRVEILYSLDNTNKKLKTQDEIIDKQQIETSNGIELPEERKAFSSTSSINDLEVGKTLILKNLNFEGGTAILLPEAQPTMELLLKTMKENPTLEIEIGGHVCCFNDMPLSVLRAQTVLKYLVKKGIDESRMTYKGYSRNKPIIEDDRREADAKINRRVEITILKK